MCPYFIQLYINLPSSLTIGIQGSLYISLCGEREAGEIIGLWIMVHTSWSWSCWSWMMWVAEAERQTSNDLSFKECLRCGWIVKCHSFSFISILTFHEYLYLVLLCMSFINCKCVQKWLVSIIVITLYQNCAWVKNSVENGTGEQAKTDWMSDRHLSEWQSPTHRKSIPVVNGTVFGIFWRSLSLTHSPACPCPSPAFHKFPSVYSSKQVPIHSSVVVGD